LKQPTEGREQQTGQEQIEQNDFARQEERGASLG
jgi:hypothetical protein